MLPKPSEAWAIGSIREPTEAAAPPDEPPEMRLVSQGLRVGPYSRGSQVRERPSSQELVRPKMTSPEASRRSDVDAILRDGWGIVEEARAPGDAVPCEPAAEVFEQEGDAG